MPPINTSSVGGLLPVTLVVASNDNRNVFMARYFLLSKTFNLLLCKGFVEYHRTIIWLANS